MDFSRPSIQPINARDFHSDRPSVHTYVEIALLDRTQPAGLHLYEVKRTVFSFEDLPSVQVLRFDRDAFAYIGEVSHFNKLTKQAVLLNKSVVTYTYLVVVSGPKTPLFPSYQSDEFCAGVQTLLEALKIQKRMAIPLEKSKLGGKQVKLSREERKESGLGFLNYAIKFQGDDIGSEVKPKPFLVGPNPDRLITDLNTAHRYFYEVYI